jgi:Phosphate-induced protein 1 conserved region
MKLRLLSGVACLVLGTATMYAQVVNNNDLKPTGKGWGEQNSRGVGNAKPARPIGSNGISYHGGPVMTSGPNVYYIWYGWGTGYTDSTAMSILTNLAQHEGGTPYFNINTTYYDGSNVHVANNVVYKGSTTDNYSQGKSLSDASIQTIVANHISAFGGPDPNGVYFVLTSADVNETSGFCTQYCGWHTHGTISGSDIKYAFVGNPARCLSACAAQSTSPNNDPGGDGMASIIAHELEEATTDPDLNAWYDNRGEENADKCAWTFGTESTASNGSKYNVTIGGTNYLIQRNWVNASGGYCSMSY